MTPWRPWPVALGPWPLTPGHGSATLPLFLVPCSCFPIRSRHYSGASPMVFDRMDDRPAFVGIPTFLHVPQLATVEDLQREQPDAVIVGAPTDTAVTHPPPPPFPPP